MVSPIQMFDVNAINAGRQAGMQRGAVNSPFTPLGQALDKTLQKYDAHMAAQAAQNNAMALQQSKNQTDLDVAKIGAGYTPEGVAPAPEITPEIVWAKGPNGEDMYATKKSDKGRIKQSDFTYAPRPVSAEQQLKDLRAKGRMERMQGQQPNVIEQGAQGSTIPVPEVAQPPATQTQSTKGLIRQVNKKTGAIRYIQR